MALFKIYKGDDSARLTNPSNPNYLPKVDGYCYFDTSTGLFYIDARTGGTDQNPIITRAPLNALKATQDIDGNRIDTTYLKKSIGTTKGDIIYWSGNGTPVRLGAGSNGQVLKIANGIPTWATDNNTDTGATSVEVTGTGNAITAASYNASTRKLTLTKGATYNNYSLPIATASALGGVKSSTTGTTANRDYAVEVKSDGTMKVNVPWTDHTYSLAGLVGSTAIGKASLPIYWNGSKFTTITSYEGNAATATEFASNKSVTLTGDITGTASSKGGWSVATTIGEGKVTNAMLAGSIANNKLANSKVTIAGNSISLGGSLAASTLVSSLGLSRAMRFIGTTTAIADGSTETPTITSGQTNYTNKTAGDVVLNTTNNYEYLWTGSAWQVLGPGGSYDVAGTAAGLINALDVSSSSTGTATTTFVSNVTQTDGKISVTKSALDTSGTWAGKATTAGVADSAKSVAWSNVSGKPSTFTPSSHTHNYAGSSSAGGGAKRNESYQLNSTTATYGGKWQVINQWITSDRLKIQILNDETVQSSYPIEVNHAYKLVDPSTEKNRTTALLTKGSATQPVYFSKGVPVACTYSLNKTVPSDAKFTDTVYTHPTSSGNKHIPSGGSSGQILRWSADGTAAWGADTNTAHSHSAGVGLTGSGSAGTSGTYTYKVNLVNETASTNAASYTAGGTSKFYAVQLDKNNKLGVYVPWTDNNTTYTFTNKAATLSWGAKSTIATVGGVDITVTMPANPNKDTHYTTGITAGATGTTSNSATTNGNTFIKIKDNSTHRGQIKIVGSGATTVTSDANGVITISSTDNNTTYGSMSVSEGTTGTATTNRVLTAANLKGIINAHAPTKTGGGASGTWGINISGDADTVDGLHSSDFTKIYKYTIPAKAGVRIKYPSDNPCLITVSGSNGGAQLIILGTGYGAHGTVCNKWTELVSCSESYFTWSLPEVDEIACSIEVMNHRDSDSQVIVWANNTVIFSAITALTSPKQNHVLLHSKNYTNYTVTKTGNGASGTWGINISGSSASCTGNAATATKLATARTISLTGSVTGSGSFDGSGNLSIATTTNHSHNYAGSTSAGGSANSAVKLDTATAGSSTQPVYFSGGKPVAITGAISNSTTGNAATATNADKLDGYHEYSFLRYRDTVSGSGGTSHSNSLWSQIGIRQYNNALPDGMADNATYTWGAVVSLPGNDSRLDIWYNHQTSSNGNGLRYRTGWNSDKRSWATILDSSNYTSYTVTKSGSGASGTWPISITGNAASASSVAWSNVSGKPSTFAPSSHTHSYLPLSGGTMTGNITMSGSVLYPYSNSMAQTAPSSTTYYEPIQWFDKDNKRIGAIGTTSYANGEFATHIQSQREINGTNYYQQLYMVINAQGEGFCRTTKMYGAVWNDYAEFRICNEDFKPGQVVLENGDDTLSIASKRLQRGCSIVSDTFGFAIGETDEAKCPIAVSGRVLAYGYESREEFKKHIGWPVCSGPNGTVSIMTEEEEEKYPSRIIGTISAVPDYKTWGTGNVEVNNRIWIKVK